MHNLQFQELAQKQNASIKYGICCPSSFYSLVPPYLRELCYSTMLIKYSCYLCSAAQADLRLFRSVTQDPNHVLCKLLPEAKRVSYNLRPRVHGVQLPNKDDRNFIPRLLYKDIY